jgi:hypothetical protein
MSYEIFIGSILILCLIMIYRFFKQLNNEDFSGDQNEKSIRASYPDIVVKCIIFTYAWYLLFYLKDYHPYSRLIYLGFILVFLYVNYYPWFIILPLVLGLTYMLVGFTLINMIMYSSSLILCIYGLSQEPYKKRKEYQWLKLYYIAASILVYASYLI